MIHKVEMDPLQKKIAYSSLPRTQAKAWISRTNHFLTHKGKEWVADRDKALWNVANLHRSGAHQQASEVMRSARIAGDGFGYPFGVEGAIARAYAESRRPSHTRRMAALMRGYTSIRLSEPSNAQVDKARSSITSPPSHSSECQEGQRRRRGESRSSYETRYPREAVITHLPGPEYGMWRKVQHELSLPAVTDLRGISRYPSVGRVPSSMKESPYSHLMLSLATKGVVPESLRACYPDDAFSTYDHYGNRVDHPDSRLREIAEVTQSQSGDPTLGRVVVLQEAGAKGRVICSPNAWIQFYLYPLHQALAGYIRRAEEGGLSNGISSMYNQQRGVNHAMAVMERGGFASAVDLSSATDRFPLALQQETLRELGLGQFAEAFNDLRGPYHGPDGDLWYYNTGQAMGLYGSFPLFHLTHWALLQGLVYRLGLDKTFSEPAYAVLGDDVLIFHPDLLEAYKATLAEWGVPVSSHKCYEGDLTEFAGFMISRKGEQVAGFRPFKHVEGGFAPALPTCHAVGSRVKSWSPWWGRAFEAYQATLGKRDLALEPLVSTSEDPPGKAAYPGVSYLSSLISGFRWSSLISPDAAQAWEEESLSLLKVRESLSDIGHPGVKTGEGFDPETFRAVERENVSRERMYRRHFASDPLVRSYRAAQAIESAR
uniref:RNA-dependent RNA polymerase n=1 Tax=Xiangxi tick virus 1 TaxID=2972193 RepID=A0A9E8AD39_9VIRU|nr:MAG: RNA-dependent RNA polymerase [Xiangxi tick virus 1]UYL95368.1 MAG: RNA-dependent RNA polymerase [Xiangxi tick virus 1]